jgi:hypothetical protein
MAPGENRNGQRMARLFRRARELSDDRRACDLDEVLAQDGIDLEVSALVNPGYTACLVRPGEDYPPGIILAPGQGSGRRRFSIAHELAHFHIPTHRALPIGWCGEEDMRAGEHGGRPYEWEANDFAVELLMPRHLFARDSRGKSPIIKEIVALAHQEMYDVSVTAAALRYVDVTREACALVCAREGRIEWVAKSESFVYRIPWRNDVVPKGSCAEAVSCGDAPPDGAKSLDPYIWLENEQRQTVELFESTFAIPSQSQVVSLVWVVAEESSI